MGGGGSMGGEYGGGGGGLKIRRKKPGGGGLKIRRKKTGVWEKHWVISYQKSMTVRHSASCNVFHST